MVTFGWPPPCVDAGSTLKSVTVTSAAAAAGSTPTAARPRTRQARLLTRLRIPASGGGLRGPVAVQARVRAVRVEQLLVRAGLLDPPVVQHHDPPGTADRREPVGDHQRRAAGEQPPQPVLDLSLRAHVDVRR